MPVDSELQIIEEQAGEMQVLDRSGHLTLKWRKRHDDEVAEARKTFEDLKAKGYMAYRVEGKDKGEVIARFDPKAEKIILTPPLAGG